MRVFHTVNYFLLKNKGFRSLNNFLEFNAVLKKKRLIRLRLKNFNNFSKLFVYSENFQKLDNKKIYLKSLSFNLKKNIFYKYKKYVNNYKLKFKGSFNNLTFQSKVLCNTYLYLDYSYFNNNLKVRDCSNLYYKWLLNVGENLESHLIFNRKDINSSVFIDKYVLIFLNNYSYFFQQNELSFLLNNNFFDKFNLLSYSNKLNLSNLDNLVVQFKTLNRKNNSYLDNLKKSSTFFRDLFKNRISFESSNMKYNISILKSFDFTLYMDSCLNNIFKFKIKNVKYSLHVFNDLTHVLNKNFLNIRKNNVYTNLLKKYGFFKGYINDLVNIDLNKKLFFGFFGIFKELSLIKRFILYPNAIRGVNEKKSSVTLYKNNISYSFFSYIFLIKNFLKFYFSSINVVKGYKTKNNSFLYFNLLYFYYFFNIFFFKQRTEFILLFKNIYYLKYISFNYIGDFFFNFYSKFYKKYFYIIYDFFYSGNFVYFNKSINIYDIVKFYKKNLYTISFNSKSLNTFFIKYFLNNYFFGKNIINYFFYLMLYNYVLKENIISFELSIFSKNTFYIYNLIWLNKIYNR